jgi:hypothetical protein
MFMRQQRGDVHPAQRLRQQGQVLVLFALLLPVVFAIGSVVVTVGNWYVHKRHLQTQVDAAVLAAAPVFTDCFLEGDANADIKNEALKYAGDRRRSATSANPQVQEPEDVRVVLNSSRYWEPSDGDNTSTGYGLDWTMDGDASTPGTQSSLPCDASFLEARATDHELPLVWRWLPFFPSPKTKARVEIRKSKSVSGFLPWAVPENNPRTVAALFVDEGATGAAADSVLNFALLAPPPTRTTLNGESVALWTGLAQIPVVEQTGVIVLQSRQQLAQEYFVGKTLSQLCSAPSTTCFGSIRNRNPSVSNRTGVAFVHGEEQNDSAGPGLSVTLGIAELSTEPFDGGGPSGGYPCSDDSSPYFNWTAENCDVRLRAHVAFNGSWDPGTREVRVSTSPFGNNCNGGTALRRRNINGDPNWWEQEQSWTRVNAGSGRNLFYLCWSARTNPPNPQTFQGFFGNRAVQMAFAANTDSQRSNTAYSGPIIYLDVPRSLPGGSRFATIQVGLQPALQRTSDQDAQPTLLRIAGSGSLNQMIDCDPPNRGPSDEIRTGCETPYQRNTRNLVCDPTWTTSNLPPTGQVDGPGWVDPDCVEANPGDVTALAKGLHDRFEAPTGANCSPNLWPEFRESGEVPPVTDKRYVTLVIAEYGAFEGQGNFVLPITKFAGFYVTGWFVGGGAQGTQGCPTNDPPPTTTLCKQGRRFRPCTASDSAIQGAVWGYFVTTVPFAPRPRPSDELCVFSEPDQCIAVLVE